MKKVSPRQRRKYRIRKSISGTPECPRLSVYRSDRYTSAQIVDDRSGKTLFGISTQASTIQDRAGSVAGEGGAKSAKSVAAAKALGLAIAEKCKELSIEQVKFDRNGFLFHGRVQAVADGTREGGIKL